MSQSSVVQVRTPGLTAQVIDHDTDLLEQSYNLRYQVYCLERGFLPAENYPEQREVDEFDEHSIHIGVLNAKRKLVGTARLVRPSEAGFPLFQHCTLFDDAPSFNEPRGRIIEASRLAVSRQAEVPGRRQGIDILLHIFKGLYQASKRERFTHWLAATEKSLQRLMTKYGFPWNPVGPETDYYGCVAPYLLNLREFDQVILSGRIPMLDIFLDGLELEFAPVDIWQLVEALR